MTTYFDGVANLEELRKSFKKQAINLHPDKVGVGSTAAFQELNKQYEETAAELLAAKEKEEARQTEEDTKQRQKQNRKKQREPRMECGGNRDNVTTLNEQSMAWEEYLVEQRKIHKIDGNSTVPKGYKPGECERAQNKRREAGPEGALAEIAAKRKKTERLCCCIVVLVVLSFLVAVVVVLLLLFLCCCCCCCCCYCI